LDLAGAQDANAGATSPDGKSEAGFVDVIMKQEGPTLNMQLSSSPDRVCYCEQWRVP